MIIERFKKIAARYEHKIALKTGEISLTYGELQRKANCIARIILQRYHAHDMNPTEQAVALLFNHGLNQVISLLAVLKTGKIYIPFESTYPGKRLEFMLQDADARMILTDSSSMELAKKLIAGLEQAVTIIDIDEIDRDNPGQNPGINIDVPEDQPAYIIYTSGSTGKPRGVLQTCRNVVFYAENYIGALAITPGDRMTYLSSFSHDGAVQDIYGAILSGATLYSFDIKRIGVRDTVRRLIEEGITIYHSVPSVFRYFVGSLTGQEEFFSLRLLVTGGEPFSARDVTRGREFFPGAQLAHMYGQTESSVNTMGFIDVQKEGVEISLGNTLPGVELLLLDENGEEVLGYETAEIYVSCRHISPGYWKNPTATKKAFLYDSELGEVYRTGDLGRRNYAGRIEFKGRKDNQVKIRGFRVELGEIEKQLDKHQDINEAVVICRDGENGDQYLCAYIVGEQGVEVPGLKEYLSAHLPDYMIPAYIVRLGAIPLNPNGKIDRDALPVPGIQKEKNYVAPRDEVEKKLAAIWSEVLGRDQLHVSQLRESIGIHNNFFEMGGHSLTATILLSRIHKKFDIQIPLVEFFKTPTIKALAGYMRRTAPVKFVSLEPVEEKEYYPLSSAQKRLYILQQFEENRKAYNMPVILTLEGNINTGTMENIFKKLISRHESLRTSFETIRGEPVQRIQADVEFEIQYFNISPGEFDSSANEESCGEINNPKLESIIIDLFISTFDLAKAPLIRVGLRKISKDKHILMIDMHHIAADGMSGNILIRDFKSLYAGQELPPLRLGYKEYSQWQQSPGVQNLLRKQEEYWLKEFEENIPVLNMPTDYSRPAFQSFEGERIDFDLSVEGTKRINEIAHTGGATLFMVILAVYNIFLSKLSSQEDIVVGIPIAGRKHTDLQKIVGVFINMLALRNYPSREKTFPLFLEEIKEKTIKAFENQDYQLEDIVEKTAAQRDRSRNPLFDVSFSFQNFLDVTGHLEKSGEETRELKTKPYNHERTASKFDLTLRAALTGEKLYFKFEYCTKLFSKETISGFIQYFKKIISSEVMFPGKKISAMDMMNEEEKKQVLYDFNATETGYPKDKAFHELFADQEDRTPGHIVVVGPSLGVNHEWPLQISYRELNNRANHLARLLRSKYVKPGTIVGLMVNTSLEMVVGMIGILKAGGAFLPIEPGSPAGRIKMFLKDSQVKILVTQANVKEIFSAEVEIVNIEDTGLYTGNCVNPGKSSGLDGQIYLTYTSGAGGSPKGVLITHENLVNYIHWFVKTVRLTADDKAVLTSYLDFDAFYTQLFSSLLTGCQLHIIPRETFLFTRELLNYLEENKITYIKITPHLFNFIVNHPGYSLGTLRKLRLVVLVGEEIKVKDVEKAHRLSPHLQVMNHYGLTETTIGSIARFIDFDKFRQCKTAPTIGKPLHNTKVYILDTGFNTVPIGVTGRLFIGGDGVGMGYLNHPELTAKRFNQDLWDLQDYHDEENQELFRGGRRKAPCSMRLPPGRRRQKIYKTGDLARWLPDGNIEFLGRIDCQVTIRGYRVDLDEIRDRLANHPGIKDAVVVTREKEPGEKIIYAYFVGLDAGASEDNLHASKLRNYLSENIPGYMIPAHFIKIEKIPLTSNSKIDGTALAKIGKIPDPGVVYSPPTTETEKKIAGIWAEVLKLDKVNIHDDFFELGGNSLTVITLTTRIREIGCFVTLSEVMSVSTIKELASIVDKKNTSEESKENINEGRMLSQLDCIERLNNSRSDKNIFIIHSQHGMVNQYKDLAELLKKKYNVYGIQARGIKARTKVAETPRQLINDYLEQILALQKKGPYIIAGYCVGTSIGYEIVRILESMNHQVEKLILFDSHCFFSDKYINHLRKLEKLPGFINRLVKKVVHYKFQKKLFKKKLRHENLLEMPGSEGGEMNVREGKQQEKFKRYLTILSFYIFTLGIIKAPILAPLVVNKGQSQATEGYFDKITKSEAKVVTTPGNHHSLWYTPNVETLAEIILKNV